MPSNPKCIVFKKRDLTDEQLAAMAETIPLASECLKCQRRKDDRLEKICFVQL